MSAACVGQTERVTGRETCYITAAAAAQMYSIQPAISCVLLQTTVILKNPVNFFIKIPNTGNLVEKKVEKFCFQWQQLVCSRPKFTALTPGVSPVDGTSDSTSRLSSVCIIVCTCRMYADTVCVCVCVSVSK